MRGRGGKRTKEKGGEGSRHHLFLKSLQRRGGKKKGRPKAAQPGVVTWGMIQGEKRKGKTALNAHPN